MASLVSARFRPETIEALEPRIVPATFIVFSEADSGPGTLRQAILDANETNAIDLIRIEGIESIELVSALPEITERIIFQGNGATLDGSALAGTAIGVVLGGNGSRSEIYDLHVTHFPGHGFVLGDFWFGYIEGCSAVENGGGTGGAGFWVRSSFATLRDVQAIGNGGPGILFDNDKQGFQIEGSLVEGAYTRDNGGPEVHIIDLERSAIVTSTFVHGDGAALAVNTNASYAIAFDGNTYIGTSTVPIDLGNNGLSPHDAPAQSMGYLGPDGWADAPVLTEFKALGDVSYVRGFVRSGYMMETEIAIYAEQVVDGNVVRFEIERFTAKADENGLVSFLRILPAGAEIAETKVRATRTDDLFRSQTSEMSDAITASVGGSSPLLVIKPKKVIFTDWDGDRVVVTTTKGSFDASDFDLVPGEKGFHLAGLRLDSSFEGAKVTIKAKNTPTSDGWVAVGEIHAEGVNLHSLSVRGDLRELAIGREDGSVSLKKLSVITLGYDGIYSIPYAAEPTIVAEGSIREINSAQTIENAVIVSFGGSIGKLSTLSLTGSLVLAHNIGTIKTYTISGSTIRAETGSIGHVEARGGIGRGAYDNGSEIAARTTIGSIVSGGIWHSRIVAHADPATNPGSSPKAIGSVTVKRDVVQTQILAGVPLDPLIPEGEVSVGNPNARIGTVSVGRDWIASDLAAGIDAGADEQFGTADDTYFPGSISPKSPSIARLVIKGEWMAEEDDIHAVVARTLGTIKVKGTKLPISTGPFSQTVATAEFDGDGEMRIVQR